jgi:4-hydroxybenzoate polyprenyltransferase
MESPDQPMTEHAADHAQADPMRPRSSFAAHVLALRPKQWTKNTFVFAGLIFAKQFTDPELCVAASLCAGLFCLGSSAIYLVNDITDVDEDRLHPKKRKRPIASGQVAVKTAWVMAAVLFIAALVGSWFLFPGRPWVFACMAVYLAKELLYTFWLKHVVIVDILVNSVGFPLRAIAGILAIRMPGGDPIIISAWFLACIFFLSLFISVCKRRHELVLLQGDAANHRAVLAEYSHELLDQLVAISTSATVICYALYTILKTPGSPEYLDPSFINPMVWTVPFVIFGIFRYLYLVYRREEGGAPEHLLFNDRWLLADVLVWLLIAGAVLMK